MLSIGIIRNMILKSFSKRVDISIYIHGVPHKPDICCIDFFSVVYFILSNNILICSLLGGLNVTTGCAHATTSKSDSLETKEYVCGQMITCHLCNFYANLIISLVATSYFCALSFCLYVQPKKKRGLRGKRTPSVLRGTVV